MPFDTLSFSLGVLRTPRNDTEKETRSALLHSGFAMRRGLLFVVKIIYPSPARLISDPRARRASPHSTNLVARYNFSK